MIETAIMDGSYDSNNNFQILSFKGIKPAIKVQKELKIQKDQSLPQKQDCKDAEEK